MFHLLTMQVIRAGDHVAVRIRTDLGFINDKTPEYFNKQPVYVCMMAELSDGHLMRAKCSRWPSDSSAIRHT